LTICGKKATCVVTWLLLPSSLTFTHLASLLRYIGFNTNSTQKWPYFPDTLDPPEWKPEADNWVQVFFLFVTLLNNFVPLSMYVTVEIITAALRIFINLDIDMYHAKTDTRTVARSTTVTDLGQVQYIFSDKTGTLTQNIMVFKRCSIDGNVFGAPVIKATPDSESGEVAFHPLKRLLTGKITLDGKRKRQHSAGLEGLGGEADADHFGSGAMTQSKTLTFNAEMFLRVMSICHTVVVEKDFDANTEGVVNSTNTGSDSKGIAASIAAFFTGKKSSSMPDDKDMNLQEMENGGNRARANTTASVVDPDIKNKDGAPGGFAYQAESPDEGALVQVSSLKFDFQVVGRDSSGIQLSCKSPSLLQDTRVSNALKSGTLTPRSLAAETGSPDGDRTIGQHIPQNQGERVETWKILAINKFDSTRKRMSSLVRSPPELGGVPMLLCKGADTAMLDADICVGGAYIMTGNETPDIISQVSSDLPRPPVGGRGVSGGGLTQQRAVGTLSSEEEDDWERSSILGIQNHLGMFAREGLRTLVLGVRVLTEVECQSWLEEYNKAAASITDRDAKLTLAAQNIERKLHIVGASAIEDKLQDGVPETIKKLGEAGIKLWVLTGDKRETAKEIGYATQVLTENMRPGLIEVSSAPQDEVRTKMCMEFLKLVKYAKLPDYQKAAVGGDDSRKWMEKLMFKFGKCKRSVSRSCRRFFHKYVYVVFQYCFGEVSSDDPTLKDIDKEKKDEAEILRVSERRRGVRERAEKIVREYTTSGKHLDYKKAIAAAAAPEPENTEVPLSDTDLAMESDEERLKDVFSRGDSARLVLDHRKSRGQISATEVRGLTMANVTAHDVTAGEAPLVDEEILSMNSFMPTDGEEGKADYNILKRTLLERIFAVDKATRHGRLVKHLHNDKLQIVEEGKALRQTKTDEEPKKSSVDGPRALVIEGAALDKLLGDTQLEEILFAVASTCDSVIACRVSPAQKAQLVQLVRRYVVPEPVTLAIGDGANDVGMIQEAHVGIGISGKEGQQAVNSSDFAIAQLRQSTVVLFSFYKNAVMAGCLIIYSAQNLYSGTPLFDEWIIAMLNFVAGMPIAALGFWDRNLDKEYVRSHPEVYGATRQNQLITNRIRLRWVALVFVHVFTLYYFTVPALASGGGGSSSAFLGLMRNEDMDRPGNGEGGDLSSVGLVTFTCMVVLLAYKVAFESRSIIVGKWPAITCKKDPSGECWIDRVAWTWVCSAYFSICFYLFGIYVYNILGRSGASSFSYFVDTVFHVLHTRSISWMMIILVPIAGMVFDVSGKVYSNLFYPTQTQIHLEIFAEQGANRGTESSESYSAAGRRGMEANGDP
jgi:magnesium-transporting ATPase (P-type)